MDNIKKFTSLDIKDDIESLPRIEVQDTIINFNEDINVNIDEDYIFSRSKLIHILDVSEAVMNHCLDDMSNNPGPRTVEAYSSLIRVTNDTLKELFSLHEKIKTKLKPEVNESKEENGKTLKTTITDILDNLPDKTND